VSLGPQHLYSELTGLAIHEGATDTLGRMACEPIGPDQTKIIIGGNMPWIEESTDSSRLEEIIQGTATNIKTLIEAET
jgi:hypothetical protein